MVTLGDKVKDHITGFEGIVTGRATYLYGCVQVLVTAKKRKPDGDIIAEWFDEQRVDTESQVKTGGPMPSPNKRTG